MLAELTNSFAVVSYMDGDLARFVDDFRSEFTPGCPHRAHITVLPPRPLEVAPERAVEECGQILSCFHPFWVEIAGVDLFEETQVVKLNVGRGASELRTLHDILNTGPFEHVESYAYTPHMTLSMQIADRTLGCLAKAKTRWGRVHRATVGMDRQGNARPAASGRDLGGPR